MWRTIAKRVKVEEVADEAAGPAPLSRTGTGMSLASSNAPEDADEEEEEDDEVRLHEPGWKERYYTAKFKFAREDTTGRKRCAIPFLISAYVLLASDELGGRVRDAYVEGLCWVLLYYYRGVPSWQWYFPFHYAPFASDLVDLHEIKIHFELGVPFKPLEQLMGVLPDARYVSLH